MESFFHTLKTERVHHRVYATRAEARRDLFDYTEDLYNSRRLHSALGYISPADMERKAASPRPLFQGRIKSMRPHAAGGGAHAWASLEADSSGPDRGWSEVGRRSGWRGGSLGATASPAGPLRPDRVDRQNWQSLGRGLMAPFVKLPYHAGMSHYEALKNAHKYLRPKTYLEVGTSTGESLALASCASIAVDPEFVFDQDVIGAKPFCLLFSMGSDDFFSRFDPKVLFNGHHVNMAFLDGMHLYQFLLRDFINVEKHCASNSVIFMHDCLPTDSHVARRGGDEYAHMSDHPHHWAGDLWKALMILRELRPDLRITAFDAPPTGLVAVTNLDPSSTVLEHAYFDAVERYRDRSFDQATLDEMQSQMALTSTLAFESQERIASYFWL